MCLKRLVASALLTALTAGCGQVENRQTVGELPDVARSQVPLVKHELSQYNLPLTIELPDHATIKNTGSEFGGEVIIQGGDPLFLIVREGSFDLSGTKEFEMKEQKVVEFARTISETPTEFVWITSFGGTESLCFMINVKVGDKLYCAQNGRIPTIYGDLALRCARTLAAK
jgi:hypothetical protein